MPNRILIYSGNIVIGIWFEILGLIDKRDGNPDRNKEVGDRVREKFLETGLNGKKLKDVFRAAHLSACCHL